MKKYMLLGVLFCLSAVSPVLSQELIRIPVAEYIDKPVGEIALSDIGGNPLYVKLETTGPSVMGNNPCFHFWNDLIVVTTDNDQCLVFDRDGKFIRTIGKKGENSPDFRSTSRSYLNPVQGEIILNQVPQQVRYNITTGEYTGNLPKLNISGLFTTTLPPSFGSDLIWLGGDTMANYSDNSTGTLPYRIKIYDSLGKELIQIPNTIALQPMENPQIGGIYEKWASDAEKFGGYRRGFMFLLNEENHRERRSVVFPDDRYFWYLGEEPMFKETFNDTVFRVTSAGLVPRLVFETREHHWPYSKRFKFRESGDWFTIYQILETERYLLFRYCYKESLQGLFDKQGNRLITGRQKEMIKDDMFHFMPLHIAGKASDTEFFAVLYPPEIIKWFEENKEAGRALPNDIQKLRYIEERDNPVLVFIRTDYKGIF